MMNNRLRIAIIFGGRSGEHDVSLMSARSILEVLNPDQYDVVQIGISRQGDWFTGENVLDCLKNETYQSLSPVVFLPEPSKAGIYVLENGTLKKISGIDVVFPVLHGTYGEDGTMQGLLEMADVAYIGAGVLASSVGMDKALFKDVMRANDIPVLDYIILNRDEIRQELDGCITRCQQVADYPLFTKPCNLGSSVGICKCKHRSDLVEGLLEAAQFDRRILVEMGIDPREIEVSVLGNENPIASLPGEIIPRDDFYTYEEKYIHDTAELLIPAQLDEQTIQYVQETAIKAYKAIDGAGMARVDFLLDKNTGKIYLGEVNTIPGFTSISMYPKLWQASGIAYAELIERLIDLAIQRKKQRDATKRDMRS